MSSRRETCLEYFRRRLSEGWECIKLEGYSAVLLSPDGIRRELDLRNDVETLRPNGVGAITQLTIGGTTPAATNWQSVDEAIADEDVTYVQQTDYGVEERDTYALPAHSGSGTINSVKVYIRHKTDDVDFCTVGMVLRNLAYFGLTPSLSYVTDSNTWVNNPVTTNPWTWPEIDAMEPGVSFENTDLRTNHDNRCTQVYVEVDYTPPAGLENKSANMGAKMIAGKLI